MPYLISTVLLLISGVLIEFHLFNPSFCSVVTFTSCDKCSNLRSNATYRFTLQKQCMKYRAKLWYRTVWNIIYTNIFPVSVFRTSLVSRPWLHNTITPQHIITFPLVNMMFPKMYISWPQHITFPRVNMSWPRQN